MGDNHFVGQKVIELTLDSGETVFVKPMSIPLLYALTSKAEQLYPDPDPAPYEKRIDDSKTLEPGQVIPATHNPEYQSLCKVVNERRRRWANVQAVRLCVEPITSREEVIARYAAELDQLRTVFDDPPDDWGKLLLYCIISSLEDYNRVIEAANGAMAVTEEEVREKWRIFRPTLQGTRPARRGRPPKSPGVEPDNELEAQPIDGGVGNGAIVGETS